MAVQAGGGLRWRVDTPADLETGARGVAALLGTAQYVVTVDLPVLFNGPVPIATRHDRGMVLVPSGRAEAQGWTTVIENVVEAVSVPGSKISTQ